jgi:hypothetical protein
MTDGSVKWERDRGRTFEIRQGELEHQAEALLNGEVVGVVDIDHVVKAIARPSGTIDPGEPEPPV